MLSALEKLAHCDKSKTGRHKWQKRSHSRREKKFMAKGGSVCWRCKTWTTKVGIKVLKKAGLR